MKAYLKILSGIITVLIVLGVNQLRLRAEEYRHHEAHEHGVAILNLALEGNDLYIEFTSPAANIVGFEHHPRTNEQRDAVKAAVNKLQEGNALFVLSAESESKLLKSSVVTDIDKDTDHHSESEHAHGEDEHHDKEHGKADGQDRHSEFKAEYHFVCEKPDRLSQIDVKLFRIFPGIEHIEVQLITETKQTAMELTAKKEQDLILVQSYMYRNACLLFGRSCQKHLHQQLPLNCPGCTLPGVKILIPS